MTDQRAVWSKVEKHPHQITLSSESDKKSHPVWVMSTYRSDGTAKVDLGRRLEIRD